VPIAVKHVSLETKRIHVGLFAPVVVTDSLEYFPDLTADREVPTVLAQRNVLDRIPEILA
jgi:hypothetical protein